MALTAKRPEDLFEYGDIDDIKAAYRRLASAHHPDKGGDAADFQLVKNLYEAALKKIESGEPWDDGASVSWSISGSKFNMKYNFARPFEIGTMYSSHERRPMPLGVGRSGNRRLRVPRYRIRQF